MTLTKYEKARKEGYSDQEILQFVSQKDPKEGEKLNLAIQEGYSPTELIDHFIQKDQPSRARSLLGAYPKGLLQGAKEFAINPIEPLLNLAGTSSRMKTPQNVIEQVLPTQEKGPEELLQRAGNITPFAAIGPESLLLKGAQVGAGALTGQYAKENDSGPLGQAIAEGIGMSLPGLAKGAFNTAKELIKAPAEKLASGITKPAALETQHAAKGIISPDRQEKTIAKLNEEASTLAKESIHRELPMAKKIEEGFDFEKRYQTEFGKLKEMAEKANPAIETMPLSEFLSKSAKQYENIPSLHVEGQKVAKEIKAFHKSPKSDLDDLLKIYRSNNKKIKNIYETSRTTGKQQEYVDFLIGMNKKIGESFEGTLKDSQWLKLFKEMNAEYSQFKNTHKALGIIEPVLGQKATPASLEKFATDKRLKQKLVDAMGPKGADEIGQIATDLKAAVESIKKIPAKELKLLDKLAPLSLFVPHMHGLGAILSLKKNIDWVRRGYGLFLSSPSKRKQYSAILKALIKKDYDGYLKTSNRILKAKSNED